MLSHTVILPPHWAKKPHTTLGVFWRSIMIAPMLTPLIHIFHTCTWTTPSRHQFTQQVNWPNFNTFSVRILWGTGFTQVYSFACLDKSLPCKYSPLWSCRMLPIKACSQPKPITTSEQVQDPTLLFFSLISVKVGCFQLQCYLTWKEARESDKEPFQALS